MRVLSAQLPPRAESVAHARTLVRTSLADVLSDTALGEVQLLVSELVTNGVRHADMTEGERIELAADLDREARELLVEVRHPGAGFITAQRHPESPVDSGWGLHILQRLSDSWGVSGDGSTSVWFTIAIDRPDRS
jgi:anti-sigma regulatory factor (Ser/Thr protein kinase)